MTGLPKTAAGRPRRGMALPMVIVVLLVLTASFAGGVALARGERALDDAGKTSVLAQTYAESGLQRIISDRAGLGLTGMPGASDSTRVTFTGGYYDVLTTRLRTAVGTTVSGLYFMRSHAVITTTGIAGGPSAEYTVTQMAVWTSGTMSVQSAMTGVNGTNKSGASGTISGVDECLPANGGGAPTIPAVAVPTTGSDGGPGYDGSTAPLVGLGTPPISYLAATPTLAAAAVPIAWAGVYAGTSITPDTIVRYPSFPFPSTAWFTAHPSAVVLIENGPYNSGHEFIMPNNGSGMLIVQEDLRFNGTTVWDGILLVGGRLRSNGTAVVRGATVTGLNTQLGYTPDVNDMNDLNGTKQFLYNSCSIRSALNAMGKLRVFGNTWSNNFKTF